MTEGQDEQGDKDCRNKQEKIDKILEALKNAPEGLTPKEMARRTGIKHSTVKSYLRELDGKGIVERKVRGLYVVSEKGHEDIDLPNIHNMRLMAELPEDLDIEHEEREIEFPFAEMTVEIGETHHRATGTVSAEPPLPFEVGCLLGKVFGYEVERAVGYEVDHEEDVMVSSCEFNKDHFGVRLDGINSVTLRDLYEGVEEKLYQRDESIRHETRILRSLTLEDLSNLVAKGTTLSHFSKRYRNIESKVGKVHEDYQKMVEGLVRTNKLNRKLLDKLDEIRDGLQEVNFSKEGEPNG